MPSCYVCSADGLLSDSSRNRFFSQVYRPHARTLARYPELDHTPYAYAYALVGSVIDQRHSVIDYFPASEHVPPYWHHLTVVSFSGFTQGRPGRTPCRPTFSCPHTWKNTNTDHGTRSVSVTKQVDRGIHHYTYRLPEVLGASGYDEFR